jgi:hypothetical protein
MSRVSESDTTSHPQNALHLCFASYLRLRLRAWNEEFRKKGCAQGLCLAHIPFSGTSYQDFEIQKIIVITLTKLPLYYDMDFFQNCGRYSL